MASDPAIAKHALLRDAVPAADASIVDGAPPRVGHASVSADGADLVATADAPVGGQAVIEGVMMRGIGHWALAVRKEDGEIATETHEFVSKTRTHGAYRKPVIRGVVALVESMGIGIKALQKSANHQVAEEEEEISGFAWVATVIFSLAFAIGFFFLLPLAITQLWRGDHGNAYEFVLIEKITRIAIFLLYLWVISLLPDLRRVFEYHGAEHKTIFNYESGLPLTPDNAARFSRFHPRCGTSFLLLVFIVSIFVLAPLGRPVWWILYPSRIIAVPLIAGLAFELIKMVGKHRTRAWARAVMWPGLQLQRFTTREPDKEQLAVAIASLEAVLDREDPRTAGAIDKVGMEVVA